MKMLPRMGLFRSKERSINHLVMVEGDVFKTVCTRLVVRHGSLVDPIDKTICAHCLNKGWSKSMGNIGKPINKDINGRYLTREEVESAVLS